MIIGGIARDVAGRPSFVRSRRASATVPAEWRGPRRCRPRTTGPPNTGPAAAPVGATPELGLFRQTVRRGNRRPPPSASASASASARRGRTGRSDRGRGLAPQRRGRGPAGGHRRAERPGSRSSSGRGASRADRSPGAGFVAGTADLEDLADGPHQGPPAGELVPPQPLAVLGVVERQDVELTGPGLGLLLEADAPQRPPAGPRPGR